MKTAFSEKVFSPKFGIPEGRYGDQGDREIVSLWVFQKNRSYSYPHIYLIPLSPLTTLLDTIFKMHPLRTNDLRRILKVFPPVFDGLLVHFSVVLVTQPKGLQEVILTCVVEKRDEMPANVCNLP